jgi:hypothetical protein
VVINMQRRGDAHDVGDDRDDHDHDYDDKNDDDDDDDNDDDGDDDTDDNAHDGKLSASKKCKKKGRMGTCMLAKKNENLQGEVHVVQDIPCRSGV